MTWNGWNIIKEERKKLPVDYDLNYKEGCNHNFLVNAQVM